MNSSNHPNWPKHVPFELTAPEVTLYEHLEVSARRYPHKPALVFYGATLSYRQLHCQVEAIAGYLQSACEIKAGDRVLLNLQNSPHFVVAYYAILRAGGVVVPVNPMYQYEELRHLLEDTNARIGICSFEAAAIFEQLHDLCPSIIAIDYRDALPTNPDINLPDFLKAEISPTSKVIHWADALRLNIVPKSIERKTTDLCMLLYSSGTTGRPKGCMHSHWALGRIAAGIIPWMNICADTVLLMATPLFHITGMLNMMIAPILAGSTVVICSRWDKDVACLMTDRYHVSHWTMMPTMVIDLLSNPRIDEYSLQSVRRIGGGGAAMPESISQELERRWGVNYLEGYGLSETGHVLSNPPENSKRQCLGIPLYDVDARIVEIGGTKECSLGEQGEILIHTPSLFLGYWNNEAETNAVFIEIDGKRFLRTGDIGRVDEDGYFFIVDRIKRMVNASGFKVWPAEIEAILQAHPAVREVCVVSTPDSRRGETVKAILALHKEFEGTVSGEEIVSWSRKRMATYKCPRIVQFVDDLPKTASGKIDWRNLQNGNNK